MKFYAPIQKNGFTASPRGEFVRVDDVLKELADILEEPGDLSIPLFHYLEALLIKAKARESAPRRYEEEE